VTVTSAKISSVFTDKVSSASTGTSHLQAVQRRHSAAPWQFECQVYMVFQLREAWGVGIDQLWDGIDRSLVRILFRAVNDLLTVAVATGSRSKRLIVAENVGVHFFILGGNSQS
jgi:hypothetical protein